MLLTVREVMEAKPKAKMYRLADGKGLFLQVDSRGGKYWRFRYKISGKENMIGFGTYPEVSLGQARDKRFAMRKTIAEGIDPGAQKRTEKRLAVFRAENTFEAVAKEWFRTNKSKWTPEHADRLWRRIEIHLVGELGKRPIADISTLELLSAIRKVEGQKITRDEKRIKRRGGTEVSHRVLQTSSAIFNYAIVTERMKSNPAFPLRDGRALKPHKAKNYPTIKAKEIPEFLQRLEDAKTSLQNKLAIRLMLLTFVRTGELRKSTWKDVDFEAKEWRLPAHIMKMREEHIVPLSDQAIELFKELQKLSGHRELLFPPQQHRKQMLMSENTINMVIKRIGYKGKLVGHGFRALASTTLNEMGYRADVIERQLAHAEPNKIRGAYNHAEYLSERQELMQKWADLIDSLISKNGKVIIGNFKKVT